MLLPRLWSWSPLPVFWSLQPPRMCTFGQREDKSLGSSLFVSLSQTPLEEPLEVHLWEMPRCWWLSGCPWQPFRGAGFLWAGKAPRFLHADILLGSFVVTCSSRAGRHAEQSPGPDHTPAITLGEGGPGSRTRQGTGLLLRVTVFSSTCCISSLRCHPGTATGQLTAALVWQTVKLFLNEGHQ